MNVSPNVSIEMIINRDGCILLGKLTKEWCKDLYPLWILPGSDVKFGEKISVAVNRHLCDLLDMKLINYHVISVNENFAFNNHYITIGVIVEAEGKPVIKRPDEFEKWYWHNIKSIPKNCFISTQLTLGSYIEGTITHKIQK